MVMADDGDDRPRLRASEAAALLYIGAPLALFFAWFLQPAIGLPCLAGLAFIGWRMRGAVDRPEPTSIDLWLMSVAFVWTLLAGIWPIGGQGLDWLKHSAVLNLLVSDAWPPTYEGQYLRYVVGWYLIPAGLAKVMPAQLETLVGLWTCLGVYLSLRLVTNVAGVRFAAVVFVLFSGADILGYLITQFAIMPLHYEWWSGWGQISSTTTSLFWTPQHAIPGWLIIGLVVGSRFPITRIGGVIGAAVLLWSPFTVAGLAPFMVYRWARDGMTSPLTVTNVVGAAIALPILVYLTSGISSVPVAFAWSTPQFTWAKWALLMLIEWGVLAGFLAIALRSTQERALLAVAAATLAILPFAYVGAVNDLMMRGTQPAVAVLAILSAIAISRRPAAATGVIAVLSVGAVTAFAEVARNAKSPRHSAPSVTLTMAMPTPDFLVQYLAPRPFGIRDRGPPK
jgi:hypothetical protein